MKQRKTERRSKTTTPGQGEMIAQELDLILLSELTRRGSRDPAHDLQVVKRHFETRQ